MISAACRAILWSAPTFCPMIPWSSKSIIATNPRSACPPGSPNCQFLPRQLLSHSYALDSLSFKFQIVPSRTHDLHKLLCAAEFASACRLPISFQIVPSRTHNLHKLLCAVKFAFACILPMSALLNPHLRAGCQCLCCWISRQPLFSSAYPPDEFSCLAWTFHRPALFSIICAVDFPLTNLQLHKFALLIYPTIGMAASTLRHCFGQLAEVYTSYTFDTVTGCMHGNWKRIVESSCLNTSNMNYTSVDDVGVMITGFNT